jgi:hypothetical protein
LTHVDKGKEREEGKFLYVLYLMTLLICLNHFLLVDEQAEAFNDWSLGKHVLGLWVLKNKMRDENACFNKERKLSLCEDLFKHLNDSLLIERGKENALNILILICKLND